jgi:CheY-like chemotaxis protein
MRSLSPEFTPAHTCPSTSCKLHRLVMMPLVLVVDDSDEIRAVWRALCVWAGYPFAEAKNGLEAIERAREHRPDAIVMDVSMPVLDGVEATRRLQADRSTASIPVVIVSADADAEPRARAAGASAFLQKPVRLTQLLSAIQEVLSPTSSATQTRSWDVTGCAHDP